MEKRIKDNTEMMLEIQSIRNQEIPELLNSLPCDCYYKADFSQVGGLWRLEFKCNSMNAQFYATAVHGTPREAFAVVKTQIFEQIENWHEARSVEVGLSPITTFAQLTKPRILLIDDDEDLALAMNLAFDKIGWQADVAVQHEGLHTKIATGEVDYILLDWNLNDAVTADRVFEKAIRLIDTFSDLREKFTEHKPCILTYSVLDREQVRLPPAGTKYFEHLDHWQKPLPYWEVVARATELMKSHNGVGRWGAC